jgi:hypothetical protein
MRAKRSLILFLITLGVITLPEMARAQRDTSVRIEKRARLTSDGGVVFRVHIACGPLPGTMDFTEGFAGALQEKSGAEAEGGLSPDIVCDGVERLYTAGLSPITEEVFVRGPAAANAAFLACNMVGDEQVCVNGSAERRIVLVGRPGLRAPPA